MKQKMSYFILIISFFKPLDLSLAYIQGFFLQDILCLTECLIQLSGREWTEEKPGCHVMGVCNMIKLDANLF